MNILLIILISIFLLFIIIGLILLFTASNSTSTSNSAKNKQILQLNLKIFELEAKIDKTDMDIYKINRKKLKLNALSNEIFHIFHESDSNICIFHKLDSSNNDLCIKVNYRYAIDNGYGFITSNNETDVEDLLSRYQYVLVLYNNSYISDNVSLDHFINKMRGYNQVSNDISRNRLMRSPKVDGPKNKILNLPEFTNIEDSFIIEHAKDEKVYDHYYTFKPKDTPSDKNVIPIPKVLYKTGKYKYENLPPEIIKLFEKTKSDNPEFELKYYDNNMCREFIRANFDEKILNTFNRLLPGAYKADLFRYCVLYINGGFYGDLTETYMYPLDSIVDVNYDKLFILEDRRGSNSTYTPVQISFLACIPKLDILNIVIEKIWQNVENNYYGKSALSPTGPSCFGKILKRYKYQNYTMKLKQIGRDNIYDSDNDLIIKRKLRDHVKYVYDNNNNGHYSVQWVENNIYDTNNKFFNEYPGKPHLDARYGDPNVSMKEITDTLIYLLKEFMEFSSKNDIKPILMYGALIGYFFNKKMLPWDDDVDLVLADEKSIQNLKDYDEEDFIIEVNPSSNNYSTSDEFNMISARVISKKNGIFIDLTYGKEKKGKLYFKDGNVYKKNNIFPLKKGKFENIEVYLPNNIEKVLKQRYGKKVVEHKFKNWIFNGKNWVDNSIKDAFESIYKRKYWGDTETLSGGGSTPSINLYRMQWLAKVIKNQKITNVLDVCGDCAWQGGIPGLEHINYHGVDVSKTALERAIETNLERTNMTFETEPIDIEDVIIQGVDDNEGCLLLLKEVIQHLPLSKGLSILRSARTAGIRYAAITHHDPEEFPDSGNSDVPMGGFYPNNMLDPPFNFTGFVDDVSTMIPISSRKAMGNFVLVDLQDWEG